MDGFNNFFFSLTWSFDRDSTSDIVLYLKWLTGPKKVVIMIRCKIVSNFDMIWYSVIFAANLYLSIFVWSSDIRTSFLWMLSFLFWMRLEDILATHYNYLKWAVATSRVQRTFLLYGSYARINSFFPEKIKRVFKKKSRDWGCSQTAERILNKFTNCCVRQKMKNKTNKNSQ